MVLALVAQTAAAAQTDIHGPLGSGAFGTSVAVLPNGNIVVTDPNGPVSNVGAVYMYSPAGVLISTLTGSTADDHVGDGGIVVLSNGNYLIRSLRWNNGTATQAGAVTWANGSTGVSGVVSAANSLVGTSAGDQIGWDGVIALSKGNFVVSSSRWDHGGVADVGAVTWGNGTTGIAGVVSAANSLYGKGAGDLVGAGVTALSNGNYVVRSPSWRNVVAANAGAVTFGNGGKGISGLVSSVNSLVGTTAGDQVGSNGITALSNGNYVVSSQYWHNGAIADAGAATWGNGTTGISGAVSAANSLVGTSAADQVAHFVTALSNGNYVVRSSSWHNGAATSAGAATWGRGSTGISGAVSAVNSLIGTTASDSVGLRVTALSNGNYVVGSPSWNNGGTVGVGAATWGNGSTGIFGVVSAANSLIGTTAGDQVGSGITALTNGNYVVGSPSWDNGGTANAGAATWGNGSTGITGAVSAVNSLVGTTAGDAIASYYFSDITALRNGNYVVSSIHWHNGGTAGAGAATWGNGSTGISGVVSAANSLVGTNGNDYVGYGITALSNGGYVIASPYWSTGGVNYVGAVTWCNGSTSIAGVLSAANSLIGTTGGDHVGGVNVQNLIYPYVTALDNGNYVISSSDWDNGGSVDAGAVSLGRGSGGTFGPILGANSVIGTVAVGGLAMAGKFAYDATRDRLVVGQPAANLVSLFQADLLFTSGFE